MIDQHTTTQGMIESLEFQEAFVWRDFYKAASSQVVESCGVNSTEFRGGTISIVSKIDVLALNRVVGLGLENSVEERDIEEIIARYSKSGVMRFFIQIPPTKHNAELPEILLAQGFKHHNNWIKLYYGKEAIPSVRTPLRIVRISPADSGAFADIVSDSFGWPDSVKPWVASLVGRDNWSHYMAFDGEIPVATGAMFVSNDWAWLGMASTRPGYRGQGAQSALLERRIKDAKALGCRTISLETAEITGEKDAPSFRNVQRFGFQIAYIRPNYLLVLKP